MSTVITTGRLELVLLDEVLLEAFARGDPSLALPHGGFEVPQGVVFKQRTFARRLEQIQKDPECAPWLLRAMVLKEGRVMCGRIGFHSPPGPAELQELAPGGVELGYEVAPEFRRRGLATEAVVALMGWAFWAHGQRSFVLSIGPENVPSLALARSLGYEEIGSTVDEEDGLELCFHRHLEHWPPGWDRPGTLI